MSNELLTLFADQGITLCNTLQAMLGETPKHRTVRRGCGYTQASRFLAEHINQPGEANQADDLAIFADWPKSPINAIALRSLDLGWSAGWRRLQEAPDKIIAELHHLTEIERLLALPEKLDAIGEALQHEESLLLFNLIVDILYRHQKALPALPPMLDKPEIGSCSQAEEFFLEIAHHRIRRKGEVNIFIDEQRQPVLVEKMQLGESHSALFVNPASICHVAIPPGALAALDYDQAITPIDSHERGAVYSVTQLSAVRFLRLTTLAVSPDNRQRAFSSQFERQIQANMLSPATTQLADIQAFAQHCVNE